ncbi:MAG: hypothetical protein RLP44_11815 [Aggregatilineales bacterium]
MIGAIQKNVTWRAIPIAGFAAGTAFLLINLILTPLILEVDPTVILRYFGALVLGSDVLTESGNNAILVGVIVHYVLSMLFTLLVTIVIHRWGLLVGIIGGALMGLALYGVNLYTMTVFFEWFFAINSSVLLLSHVIFGAVAGGVYELFDHYDGGIEGEVTYGDA